MFITYKTVESKVSFDLRFEKNTPKICKMLFKVLTKHDKILNNIN